jgi:myo-inositol 2-dehydrogenase/D-chiro-inositol 1-dehydrogenase
MESTPMTSPSPDRRTFLKLTAAGAGAAALPRWARGVHMGHTEVLKVGLVGCGGRGTGAAAQALRADPATVLWAVGDAFADRIAGSQKALAEEDVANRAAVPPERRFTGPRCHEAVIASGVDVVLLCSPPHFRPAEIAAAVAAGKHVFAEKPVAVDAPGVRRVLASVAEARERRLSVVSGLCWRYDEGVCETVRRIHDGAIGEVVALQATYNVQGLWHRPREAGWTDFDWQLRNWLYFTWLSGDLIVEQHIHSLDKMAWVLRDRYPVRAVASGGRQARTDPAFGHIYDHFNTVYEWEDGVRGFSSCRQLDGCAVEISDRVFGSAGRSSLLDFSIEGPRAWQWKGPRKNMYQHEHDELFAAIRRGEPRNDGDTMTRSTLMAIMGRMAAYTGQAISWDAALASTEDLTPASYEPGPRPMPPVAVPGRTRFR